MFKIAAWITVGIFFLLFMVTCSVVIDIELKFMSEEEHPTYQKIINDQFDTFNCSKVNHVFTITEEVAPNQVLVLCNDYERAFKIDYTDSANPVVERTQPDIPDVQTLPDTEKRRAPSL